MPNMIRHVVFFSAKDKKDLDVIYDGLLILKTNPHANHLEISHNLQTDALTGTKVDIVVYAEFSDEDQLAAYKAHPIYQESIDKVRPLRELRMAADFKA
mgnify:FL=1|jgi:hypothetical protein